MYELDLTQIMSCFKAVVGKKYSLPPFLFQVPTIQELEGRMANLLKQRAEKLVLRRQQDVRDQCQDYTASRYPCVSSFQTV